MTSRIINADCREAMRDLAADSIDAIVTDPPYGLSFMGKEWDHGVPGVPFWSEALRVLKPGAHLLAFGGTRTFHRLACAIEDAGFEIRDCVMWVYGSGFPKSLDVSKAIDKAAGAAREVVGVRELTGYGKANVSHGQQQRFTTQFAQTSDTAATDAARQWAGWGTALKPAWEPIIVARKPLRGTVAANVQQFGTGALNIGACRIEPTGESRQRVDEPSQDRRYTDNGGTNFAATPGPRGGDPLGRWPANVIHDGSDEVVALFPETTSGDWNGQLRRREDAMFGKGHGGGLRELPLTWTGDTGSAARFFYTAKASAADRNDGLHHRARKPAGVMDDDAYVWAKNGDGSERGKKVAPRGNHHPTVKPTDLMRYLCRLVTPPGGTVLDPFCGSGSTGRAALLEGLEFIGIEIDAEYAAIARDRVYAAAPLFAV